MNHIKNRIKRFIMGGNKCGKVFSLMSFPIFKVRQTKLINEVKSHELTYGLNSEPRRQKVIVSLTSYPDRFDSVTSTLTSVLLQSYKPDKIILWYSCEDTYITDSMHELEKYGVEYRHVDVDIKPHKKYFWALQEFSNDLVITIDDDVIYPLDTIENLVVTHTKFPQCVVARRVHRIKIDNGKIGPYLKWATEYKKENKPSKLLCAVGVGGILYPPNVLDKRAFDIKTINEECLCADDIWLKYMELLNGTEVVWAKNHMVRPTIVPGSQVSSLQDENVQKNRNDFYIDNCNRLFSKEISF